MSSCDVPVRSSGKDRLIVCGALTMSADRAFLGHKPPSHPTPETLEPQNKLYLNIHWSVAFRRGIAPCCLSGGPHCDWRGVHKKVGIGYESGGGVRLGAQAALAGNQFARFRRELEALRAP